MDTRVVRVCYCVWIVLLTAIYWIVLLRLASTVTDWMNTPRIRRRLDLVTGTMLIAFGVRLATES